MSKTRTQQAVLIGVGLMVAVGFGAPAISIIMTNSQIGGGGDNQDRQEINATLPSQHYRSESFDLSVAQQSKLIQEAASGQNRTFIAFVNVIYRDKANYSELETLPEEMNNRVYVNLINRSESAWGTQFQQEPPTAIVIGTQSRQGGIAIAPRAAEPNKESIKQAVCSSMFDLGDLAAKCF